MAIPTKLVAESTSKELIENLISDAAGKEQLARDPDGFHTVREGKRRGLYFLKMQQGEDGEQEFEEIRIGDPIDVIGKSRDRNGMEWGLWLRWKDADDKDHLWAVPASMFAGDGKDIMAVLLSGGWHGDPSQKKHLLRYLASIDTGRKVRCVDRVGWYEFSDGRLVYVRPDAVIGRAGSEIVVLQTTSPTASYACRGSLDGQREMFKLCMGNAFLMFSLAVGFAGPLIYLAGMESGGFNIHGASSSGKSTTGHVAGSVYDYYEQLPTWRSTDNALEGMCALRSDGLMILDEIKESPPKAISQIVYMVANGRGKARAKADASIRQPHEWRTMILSTGEMSVTSRIESSGERAFAGHEVRIADIKADAGKGMGVFEDIHGHDKPSTFSDEVRRLSRINCGYAGKAFLEYVSDHVERIRSELPETLDGITKRLCPSDSVGQVFRVSRRFALVLYAGMLAVEAGIFDMNDGPTREEFKAEFNRAVKKLFDIWLENRGGAGAAEDRTILRDVELFFEQHGNSGFQHIHREGKSLLVTNEDERILIQYGYRCPDERFYIVRPVSFEKVICNGHDASRAADVLAKHGHLRKEGNRRKRRVTVGNEKLVAYIVDYSINGSEPADESEKSF